jgi:hypothetical protein
MGSIVGLSDPTGKVGGKRSRVRRSLLVLAAATVAATMTVFATSASAQEVTPTAGTPYTATTTYTDKVRGLEVSAGTIIGDTRFGATFVGKTTGDLPGVLVASINYTPSSPGPGVTNTIVGGKWVLRGPWDTVYGSFPGGKVRWNANGTLAAVEAKMRVRGGSVDGVPVLKGRGTFSGVLDHSPLDQGLPPTVGGKLSLTF